MPLQLSAAPNAPVSLLNEWTVADADRLVESIAWLYLQKQAQALRGRSQLSATISAVGEFLRTSGP